MLTYAYLAISMYSYFTAYHYTVTPSYTCLFPIYIQKYLTFICHTHIFKHICLTHFSLIFHCTIQLHPAIPVNGLTAEQSWDIYQTRYMKSMEDPDAFWTEVCIVGIYDCYLCIHVVIDICRFLLFISCVYIDFLVYLLFFCMLKSMEEPDAFALRQVCVIVVKYDGDFFVCLCLLFVLFGFLLVIYDLRLLSIYVCCLFYLLFVLQV